MHNKRKVPKGRATFFFCLLPLILWKFKRMGWTHGFASSSGESVHISRVYLQLFAEGFDREESCHSAASRA